MSAPRDEEVPIPVARLEHLAEIFELASSLIRRTLADHEARFSSSPPGPGRPRGRPEAWQVDEVLRLRTTNGRLGERAIGEMVGLSRRQVHNILQDAAARKPPSRPETLPIPGRISKPPNRSRKREKEVKTNRG
jgi:hypothetical protein